MTSSTYVNIDNITPSTPVTFNEYYTLLSNADWFYSFSDDSRAYSLGMGREGILNGIASRHDFAAYMFSHFCDVRNSSIDSFSEDDLVFRLTLTELKARWDAMDVVSPTLSSKQPVHDVEHYESIKVVVGSKVRYNGVPMFVGAEFTVESINGTKAVITVPYTTSSRNSNAHTVTKRYTALLSSLTLVQGV